MLFIVSFSCQWHLNHTPPDGDVPTDRLMQSSNRPIPVTLSGLDLIQGKPARVARGCLFGMFCYTYLSPILVFLCCWLLPDHPNIARYLNPSYKGIPPLASRAYPIIKFNPASPVAPPNIKTHSVTIGLHRQRRRHWTSRIRYPVEQSRGSPFEPTLRGRRRRDGQHLWGRRRWRRRRRWGRRRGR